MAYDNTNSGALFKNAKKEKDTHPDYNGSINVDGVDYWLSAWLKTSTKTGDKFMSLSVKPKEEAKPPQRDKRFDELKPKEEAKPPQRDKRFDEPKARQLPPQDESDLPF